MILIEHKGSFSISHMVQRFAGTNYFIELTFVALDAAQTKLIRAIQIHGVAKTALINSVNFKPTNQLSYSYDSDQ